jgi:hypothetical protein
MERDEGLLSLSDFSNCFPSLASLSFIKSRKHTQQQQQQRTLSWDRGYSGQAAVYQFPQTSCDEKEERRVIGRSYRPDNNDVVCPPSQKWQSHYRVVGPKEQKRHPQEGGAE